MRNIISDSSCLIALENIGMLDLLKHLYGNIIISREVATEYGSKLEKWMTVRDITNKTYLRILSGIVDEGEASAIALYFEIKDSTLILDDLRARNLARDLGIKYTGLMGVLIKAKQKKLIGAVKPVLIKLEANNFRISENLKHSILKLSKEI